jgi:CHAD domain-containing protein
MSSKLERGVNAGAQLRHGIVATLADAQRLMMAEEVPISERVHGARTRVKRIRALLALLHEDLGEPDFQLENRDLRQLGSALGPLREPAARVDSYDEARQHHESALPEQLRLALANEGEQAAQGAAAALVLGQTKARLAAAQARVASWPSSGRELKSLLRGFHSCYAKARRAYQAALRSPTPEAMHALRRRTKRYQYQLQFLEPVHARRMRARRERAEALSELLGEHHDLFLLDSALGGTNYGLDEAALSRVRHTLAKRERTLRRHALSLARRLYRKRPRVIGRSLQQRLARFER